MRCDEAACMWRCIQGKILRDLQHPTDQTGVDTVQVSSASAMGASARQGGNAPPGIDHV